MISKTKTFTSIILVLAIIIFFHYLGWLRPIENFFRSLINPLSVVMYDLSIKSGNETKQFSSVEELKLAYLKLAEDNRQLEIKTADYGLLKQENDDLKKQLNFLQKQKMPTIGAQVIGKNIDPLGNTVIIDRGLEDGIKIDQPVIADNGILVGKIARVENSTSIVRLINDNQSKIAAMVINMDRSMGLVEGGYGISVRMNFVPQNETINVGDLIVSSGLEKTIPKGLLLGTVEAVEKEAYQPFQQAVLQPAINLEKLSLVSVLVEN